MPCDAPSVAAGFLFDAEGACFLAVATRLCVSDAPRLVCCDAWRTGETASDLLAATWVCTQPASEAAPRTMANRCARRRGTEPELKAARMPMRPALISRCELLAQLLENISSPAYRFRRAKGRDPIGAERSRASAIAASITRFHVSVVIEPQPAVEAKGSSTRSRALEPARGLS